MRKSFGFIALFVGASALVYANGIAAAPEISPATGAGALALISGALLIIRSRRKP